MVLVIIVLCFACISKKTVVNKPINDVLPPKIIFLNYSISKAENDKKTVEFISKTITDGKLKNNSNKYIEVGSIGDLKCSQLNKDSVEVTSVIIKNPLSKTIEFINDSIIFENKKIELQKASFSLRLQLHSETVFMAIKEIKDSLQNTNPLIINKLQ